MVSHPWNVPPSEVRWLEESSRPHQSPPPDMRVKQALPAHAPNPLAPQILPKIRGVAENRASDGDLFRGQRPENRLFIGRLARVWNSSVNLVAIRNSVRFTRPW